MRFPSMKELPDFDPNDPFDARAEEVRELALEGLSNGDFVITQENAEATMTGMTVALVGALLACTDEAGHREVVSAIEQYIPYAANMSRTMLGLPPLYDN